MVNGTTLGMHGLDNVYMLYIGMKVLVKFIFFLMHLLKKLEKDRSWKQNLVKD